MNQRAILAVDDDADTLTLYRHILEPENYKVDACSSAEDALVYLHQNSYDVVLMDINLPGMPGEEVVSWIRQREQYFKAPIIAVTGYTDAGKLVSLHKYGFETVLTKPVDVDSLLNEIRRVIALRA